MNNNPLEKIKDLDPALFVSIEDSRSTAFAEGEIPQKYKLLIALAVDAAEGAVEGVRTLSGYAKEAGATNGEIMEVMRMVHYICGAGKMYQAARGLSDLKTDAP